MTYDCNLFIIIKVIHTCYKKLKCDLKKRGLPTLPPEVAILNGVVHLSQGLSVSVSHTQADLFTFLLMSHLCGLTDGILDADGWSSCFPPKRTLKSPLESGEWGHLRAFPSKYALVTLIILN